MQKARNRPRPRTRLMRLFISNYLDVIPRQGERRVLSIQDTVLLDLFEHRFMETLSPSEQKTCGKLLGTPERMVAFLRLLNFEYAKMTGKQLDDIFSVAQDRFILGLADKQRPEEKPSAKRRRVEREAAYAESCRPLAVSQ